jgi:hypothetical protein
MEVSGQLHVSASLPQGKSPGTHWIGGWVSPRAVLDAVVKRKIPISYRDSNPPIMQPTEHICTTRTTFLKTYVHETLMKAPVLLLN